MPINALGVRVDVGCVCIKCFLSDADIWQNYTLLEQKGVISSIIDEIIKLRKT